MRRIFILITVVIVCFGCATKYKTKSEWIKSMSCNVEVVESDRALLCVQVAPEYPKRAIARNKTGNITVSFDVSSQGKAINLAVLSKSPEKTLVDAGIKAIKRWKFIPKFEGGLAVEDYGFIYSLSFSMDEIPITSKADWLKNLQSIVQNKSCSDSSADEKASCNIRVKKEFGLCAKEQSALDSLFVINDLRFANDVGAKIASCVDHALIK